MMEPCESRHLLSEDSESDVVENTEESGQPICVHLHKSLAVLAASAIGVTVFLMSSADRGNVVLEKGDSHGFVQMDVVLPVLATQICYGFTGATCSVRGCDVDRGAVCEKNMCVCKAGCSGANGICYTGVTNEPVKVAFTLSNVKWPSYSMIFQRSSSFGQLKATNAYTWLNSETDKFNLHKLPGATDSSPRFLLGSPAYLQYVARIAPAEGKASAPVPQGLFAAKLERGYSPISLSLTVCYNSSADGLMFGDTQENIWASLIRGSWLVYGFTGKKSDVGEAGLWKASPPLTNLEVQSIPPC